MKTTRQAMLKVNRSLLESIMPDWETAARVRFGEMVDGRLPKDVEQIAEPYHTALKLPANCRITGISNLYAFNRDEIVFRIESPDFVETPSCDMLPEVRAVYQRTLSFGAMLKKIEDFREFAPGSVEVLSDQGYFLCWDGPAVAVPRVYGPDGTCKLSYDPAKVSQPNPLMTWEQYRAAVNWCVEHGGSAYVWVIEGKFGEQERWPLPPPRVLRWRKEGRDCWGVRTARGTAMLSINDVEVLTLATVPSTLGDDPVDGEHAMKAIEMWLNFTWLANPSVTDLENAAVSANGGCLVPEGADEFPKELAEKGILSGKPVVLFSTNSCWRCHTPTLRRLPDGTAECQECAEKSLL